MLEKKRFRWLYAPNVLEIARDGYATEAMTSRFARLKKSRKAGKCYSFPKLFHLRMVKRVQMKNYIA